MNTEYRWIVPAYFEQGNLEKLEFDLLDEIKTILSNSPWERKFEYGFSIGLKNTSKESIKKAKATLYPNIRNGIINSERIKSIIIQHCGEFSKPYNNVFDKANLSKSDFDGLLVFEFEFDEEVEIPKSENDFNEKFVELYHRYKAISDEVASLFRASLHLVFHCEYIMIPSMQSEGGGLIQIKNSKQSYYNINKSSDFKYPVVFNNDKNTIDFFNSFRKLLSTKWHLNLWQIKRYIKALNDEYIDMENILDLIFSLEGLFDKNTSTDMIKLSCSTIIGKDKKSATKIYDTLSLAYRIRNEIVHGSVSYNGMEKIKIEGKEKLSQSLFWKLKEIVMAVMLYAIFKLNSNSQMVNLRITHDDILSEIYKKPAYNVQTNTT